MKQEVLTKKPDKAAKEVVRHKPSGKGQGLEGFLLPRPCRRVVIRWPGFASEICVGETLAADLGHDQSEAVGIVQRVVFGSTIVETEYLFGDIAIKMIWLNGNVFDLSCVSV
jgi:hypothetical protein